MDFNELRKIGNELEQISCTYELFNEDSRLNHSNSARVEFLITVNIVKKIDKNR